jgi:hypothetical protein
LIAQTIKPPQTVYLNLNLSASIKKIIQPTIILINQEYLYTEYLPSQSFKKSRASHRYRKCSIYYELMFPLPVKNIRIINK